MDRLRQKSKKEKPLKQVDKEKVEREFITDVKTIKENIKIKEILRSVKMNSSMRVKAPRGSVVMNNNDFIDAAEDHLDESNKVQSSLLDELQEAKNTDLVEKIMIENDKFVSTPEDDINHCSEQQNVSESRHFNEIFPDLGLVSSLTPSPSSRDPVTDVEAIDLDLDDLNQHHGAIQNNETFEDIDLQYKRNSQSTLASASARERKLSLDHTMLTRREGLSQSEVDLHSIGKSPLERKSSFFRKKMDSFLKNTSEIFKRQSLGSKAQPVIRRGSMSVSLQSLNEKVVMDYEEYSKTTKSSQQEVSGSAASLASGSTLGASEPGSAGSQLALSASQPLSVDVQSSTNSINGVYTEDSLLSSRAISMSSGLDSAFGQRRRKTSRSNRVTWVASEGLTNYLRRLTQDETNREMVAAHSHSYQDFSSIPENALLAHGAGAGAGAGARGARDSKGRRLSYQRAVSGEDPVLPARHDSSLRRRHAIPEHLEANYELSMHLAEFTRNGVPKLAGFDVNIISERAYYYLEWAETASNIEEVYDWKKLSANEEARQAVIRELIGTEADYIKHLMAIVEVFLAAAHALQDSGKMLHVDTARLFLNIPDVVNASLVFWEATFYPMIDDAVTNGCPFKPHLMSPGFSRCSDLFIPHERYVGEQSTALDYCRSLTNDSEFMMYLTWCHAQKSCNRLQLSDIMVKPMQRLTKYRLILRRVLAHTDCEMERSSLIAMEISSKSYAYDLNRSIRQREELEKLEVVINSIDGFEMDFKDEDMDRYFRMYSQVNLRAPMVNSLPYHSRCVIYEGDVRFKDNAKEIEARVILLTDMILICKKLPKGSMFTYKMIRPKYMLNRMMYFPKYSRNNKDVMALVFLMLDEVGSSSQSFMLSESSKDPNPVATIRTWDQKFREGRLTYELGVWYCRNPTRDLSELDMDSSSDYGGSGKGLRSSSEEASTEREARERVAAMLYRGPGAALADCDCSQASFTTDSFDDISGARPPGLHSLFHRMDRNSTSGSSRNSRLSSFQQSTSAASHDEPQGTSGACAYRAGSSVEHLIPPLNPEDAATSITVNVVGEGAAEALAPSAQLSAAPQRAGARSGAGGHNTLRVQPQSGVLALVHSLPDLTLDPSPPRHRITPSRQTASEKIYQSHQELLQRNRLSTSRHHHQHLSPDHRGTSYPPPSPTRAALQRGLAFSDSFKNPPLSKMRHVSSQAQPPTEPAPSTSSASPKSEKGAPLMLVGVSAEKEKKSKHLMSSRHKGGRGSDQRKDDKSE